MTEGESNQEPLFVPKQFANQQNTDNKQTQENTSQGFSNKIPFLSSSNKNQHNTQQDKIKIDFGGGDNNTPLNNQNQYTKPNVNTQQDKIKIDFGGGDNNTPVSNQNQYTNLNTQQDKIKIDFGGESTQSNYPNQTYINDNFGEGQSQNVLIDLLEKYEELTNLLRTNNLQISKISREVRQSGSNAYDGRLASAVEELINHTRTNSLYLSKLERAQKNNQNVNSNNSDSIKLLTELMGLMRTNNLFLSKLERKISYLEQNGGGQVQQGDQEFMTQMRTNNLYLSKVERKITQLLNTSSSNGNTSPSIERTLKSIEEKLDRVLDGNNTNPTSSSYTQGNEGFKEKMDSIEQKLNIISSSKNQITKPEGEDYLLKNVKANNLYLLRLEQKIAELSKYIHKSNH